MNLHFPFPKQFFEYMKRRTGILLLLSFMVLSFVPATASTEERTFSPDWYVGGEGGIVFGTGTISSFGADKTRAGWSAGLFGGRRFNPVLSLEFAAGYGNTPLSSRSCCAASGYWLGSDGQRYNAAVLGMDGAPYSDLISHVAMQHYGLRLNVNLLGFFARTRNSRWDIGLAPSLSLYGSKATVKRISDKTTVFRNSQKWHLGAGGRLQIGYRITDGVRAGLYSGIVWLTGQRMDGIPKHLHRNNFIWENGIRIELSARKHTKKAVAAQPSVAPVVKEQESTAPRTVTTTVTKPAVAEPKATVTEPADVKQQTLEFPTIHFAFNSTAVTGQENRKRLEEIRALLTAHPDVEVTVTGWCDKYGSRAVNARYSLRRAHAVKAWLVRHGIDAARISVKGNGSDLEEKDPRKARRAETTEKGRKEEQP